MYVDLKDSKEREVFIDELFEIVDDIHFKEEPGLTREDIINSTYPITIDVNKLEVDYLKNDEELEAAKSKEDEFVSPKVALCVLITIQNPVKYESDYVLDGDPMHNSSTETEITFLDIDDEDQEKAEEYIKSQ